MALLEVTIICISFEGLRVLYDFNPIREKGDL